MITMGKKKDKYAGNCELMQDDNIEFYSMCINNLEECYAVDIYTT